MNARPFGRGVPARAGLGYIAGKRDLRVQTGEVDTLIFQAHDYESRDMRWRLRVQTYLPDDVAFAREGRMLTYKVLFKLSNDKIVREFDISAGNAQVIYGTGQFIEVTASNPSNVDLLTQFAVERGPFGTSEYEESREFRTALETDIAIPAFCDRMQILSIAPGAILRGYGIDGATSYVETTTTSSMEHIVVQGLAYTIEFPAGRGQVGFKSRA